MYRFIITLWWFIIFDRLLSVTPHTLVFHKDLYWDPFNLVCPNVNIQLYADDTVIYADGCTKQQVASKLNNTMRHITVQLYIFVNVGNVWSWFIRWWIWTFMLMFWYLALCSSWICTWLKIKLGFGMFWMFITPVDSGW